MVFVSFVLDQHACSWIFKILSHWDNNPQTNMILHLDIISWFRANQSALTPIPVGFIQIRRFKFHVYLFIYYAYLYQFRVITIFTVFLLLTDFVCLYNYEFWLSLCKIVRSSVILLLPLFISQREITQTNIQKQMYWLRPTRSYNN